MAIQIRIPAPLRQHAGDLAVVETGGTTVKEVLANLAAQHPALVERIMDGGKVRQFVNLCVNDEDIRYLDGLDTAVADRDVVLINPAVSGG